MTYQEIHGQKEIVFNNTSKFVYTLIKNPNKIGLIYTSNYQKAKYLIELIYNNILSIDMNNCITPKLYISDLSITLYNNSRIITFSQASNEYRYLCGYKIDYILLDCIPDNLFMGEIYHHINRSD